MTCDKNCFQCPYTDCIRPIGQDETERVKEYYQAHKEARKTYYKAYRAENLDKERERDRKRDKVRVRDRTEYYRQYREKRKLAI